METLNGKTPFRNVLFKHKWTLTGAFEKNNTVAAAENMPLESHNRRLNGLFKAWAARAKRTNGEKFVPVKTTRKQVRMRARLRETVAKEAREIQEMARRYAFDAIKRCAEITQDPLATETAIISATSLLLERAYGKATQTSIQAHIDANGKPSEVDSQELDTRITEALKRVEDITGGKTKAPKGKKRPADVRERDRDTGGSTVH